MSVFDDADCCVINAAADDDDDNYDDDDGRVLATRDEYDDV